MKTLIKQVLKKVGLGGLIPQGNKYHRNIDDLDPEFLPLYEKVKPYTMTNLERLYSLYKSVEYICKRSVDGDFVECGVWKGGSSMLMALTLQKFGQTHRKLYLYDTFSGMTPPGADDISIEGADANVLYEVTEDWCSAGLTEVKNNMASTGYPKENVFFIEGMVEETIPNTLPGKLAILRLDTDWYDSTYHEMTHLYPLLEKTGVLIIDDYGYWKGSKKAIDQYFAEQNQQLLLLRTDEGGGRIAVKL